MENIEDIKTTEAETAELVEKFSSHIKNQVASKIKSKSGTPPTEEELDKAMQTLPIAEMQGLVKSALW